MMDEEWFDEIFVSSNFTQVFCTQHELDNYLNSLILLAIPKEMSIVFTRKKLNKKYTKKEIINATPDQIKLMIDMTGTLSH